MMKKLKRIILIDDDEATNYLHRMIIEKADCAEEIVVFTEAIKALDYLKSSTDGEHPSPSMILLDINMPVMNGWEFLDEYNNLPDEMKADVIVFMLSTSLNPVDRQKALEYNGVEGFKSKPLTSGMLMKIIEDHFVID